MIQFYFEGSYKFRDQNTDLLTNFAWTAGENAAELSITRGLAFRLPVRRIY